ncbi:unnamed protein product [Natator depressus]
MRTGGSCFRFPSDWGLLWLALVGTDVPQLVRSPGTGGFPSLEFVVGWTGHCGSGSVGRRPARAARLGSGSCASSPLRLAVAVPWQGGEEGSWGGCRRVGALGLALQNVGRRILGQADPRIGAKP